MFENPEQIRTLFLQLSAFCLIIALWMVGVTVFVLRQRKKARKLERRLQFAEQGVDEDRILRLWHQGKAYETFVPGGSGPGLMERMEQLRQDAGWNTPILQVVAILAMVVLLGGAALFILSEGNVILPISLAVIVVLGFRWTLLRSVSKRTALFEKQLVDALDLGARSLRAGHPLSGAFQMISEEVGAPINRVFGEIVEQEQFGIPIQQGLRKAAEKSRSPDMRIFAASVIIQLRSGGNLADMMDRVSWVVRDRMRLNRRARVLTAEAQLSKWVLLILPITLFLLFNILNPSYMEPFYNTTAGAVMIGASIVGLLMGSWVMGRMAKIDY